MNIPKAILLKVLSTFMFALMAALVRFVAEIAPVGQVVFFRSACGLIPVLVIYTLRGQLLAAIRTSRPVGHLWRGLFSLSSMSMHFAALSRIPLVETTAIGFVSPLFTVALAALVLKERVRIYRWSAVGVGFAGVIVMLWPHLQLVHLIVAGAAGATIGALLALGAALINAGSVIQTRRLTDTETNSAIVFYFSLICAVGGLLTLPFGWYAPSALELAALVSIGLLGGLSHLIVTESYRFAPASVIAPFDYATMLWAFALGYVMFGEVPTTYVFVGAAIVAAAGLFVIWREHRLGLAYRRAKAAEGSPPAS